MNDNFEAPLKIANKKHDVITIRINDKREEELPDIGLVQMKDAETGEVKWIDTANKLIRENYQKNYLRNMEEVNQLFKNSGVDTIQLRTDMDYIKPLIQFFKRRGK